MAGKWWGREEARKEEEDLEVKPPKEFTETQEQMKKLGTDFEEFKAKASVLDDMKTYLQEQKEAKEAARVAAANAAARKTTETSTEAIDQMWLEDPKKAFEMQAQDIKVATLNAQSYNVRREVFDDGTEFEFYTGEFKKEVDNIIETSLAPVNRVDPQAIKNCYYLVLGRKQKEIKEGKIKSRFASASAASGRAGEGKADEGTISLSEEMKAAAAKLGVKTEDYAKNAREMGYV